MITGGSILGGGDIAFWVTVDSRVCTESWLPGCNTTVTSESHIFWFVWNIISKMILYVAVFAVLSITGAGVLYMVSLEEESKKNKAKKWILWSVIGLLLSISAWGIVNMVNNLTISFTF